MKRKWIFFILKVVICLLFAATAVFSLVFRQKQNEKANLSMKKLLTEYSPDAPAEICISWKDNVTTLVLKDKQWYVKERGYHMADLDKVSQFLERVQNIRPLRRAVPADEATCSLLRVRPEESDPKNVPGVRIRVFDKQKKVLRDVVLGAGYFNEVAMTPGKEPEPSGRWMGIVQKDGSIVPVLISSMFEEFTPVPGSWMTCPVFEEIKLLVRIEFDSNVKDYRSWMFGRFSLKDPFECIFPANVQASAQKLNVLAGILSQRYTFEGIREADAGELRYIGKLSTLDSKGFIRNLVFYTSDKARGGVLCKVEASERKGSSNKERIGKFLSGREGWLYVIPDKVFEKIVTIPAGD